ncbi:MAG: hypothetical protein Q9222_001329 [Ikaeria aurantiellina]
MLIAILSFQSCLIAVFANGRPGSEDVEGQIEEVDENFIARNARRRTSYNTGSPDAHTSLLRSPLRGVASSSSQDSPRYNARGHNGMDIHEPSVPYYVSSRESDRATPADQKLANETAARLFQSPIATPGDALHLLLEASGRTESLQQQIGDHKEPGQLFPSIRNDTAGEIRFSRPDPRLSLHNGRGAIDPEIAGNRKASYPSEPSDIASAIRTWSRLRFVRAGWFTAQEAISYID